MRSKNMFNIKNLIQVKPIKRFFRHSITIAVCILITGLGVASMVWSSTTIGDDISTANLTASGNATTTGDQVISGTLNVTGVTTLSTTTIGGSLTPDADSANDLGSSSEYWLNTYTDKLYLNASSTLDGATAGVINTTGDFIPSSDSVYDLGSSTAYWANAYTDKLQIGGPGDVEKSIRDGGTFKDFLFKNGSAAVHLAADNSNFYLVNSSGGELYLGPYLRVDDVSSFYSNDASVELGKSTNYWGNTYVDKLYLNSTAYLDGATAGLVNLTGDMAISNDLGIGTSTISGTMTVIDDSNASTTVYIGDATHSGCLVMGDSDSGGVTYITALNGVLTATTTQPSVCQ